MKEALLKVTGKVQGVFYRAYAREKAQELGLTGYASNLPDGSVEALVQGSGDTIKQFIDWARSGSPGAKVNRVSVKWEKIQEKYNNFKIQ